jgi:hypothetical protein
MKRINYQKEQRMPILRTQTGVGGRTFGSLGTEGVHPDMVVK